MDYDFDAGDRAYETYKRKGKEAGLTDDEIRLGSTLGLMAMFLIIARKPGENSEDFMVSLSLTLARAAAKHAKAEVEKAIAAKSESDAALKKVLDTRPAV